MKTYALTDHRCVDMILLVVRLMGTLIDRIMYLIIPVALIAGIIFSVICVNILVMKHIEIDQHQYSVMATWKNHPVIWPVVVKAYASHNGWVSTYDYREFENQVSIFRKNKSRDPLSKIISQQDIAKYNK